MGAAAEMHNRHRNRAIDTPFFVNMATACCPSPRASLWLAAGRSRSATFRKPRFGTGLVLAQQKKWSRGCRRAFRSLWSWLLPLSWLLAPRKRPSLHLKSPSSRLKPESTSDLTARAWRPRPAGPAPFPCLPRSGPRPFITHSSTGSLRLSGSHSADPAFGLAEKPVRC